MADHATNAERLAPLRWACARGASLGLAAAALVLLVIVVLNAVNIVLRYAFRAPLPWAEEAMLYLMIFGVFSGAIAVAWNRAHIRIDLVVNAAPPRWRGVLNAIGTLLTAAILVPVMLASYRVASMLFAFDQRSDALHLPVWIPQSIVPAALLLIAAMSLARLLTRPQDPAPHALSERTGDRPTAE